LLELAPFLDSPEKLDILAECGADMNQTDEAGMNVLMVLIDNR
jgi:hypothetical protein